MLTHDRIRAAALRSRNRHFIEWTCSPYDYLLLAHPLQVPYHRVWELGPEPLEHVAGLILVESEWTGTLQVSSEAPGVLAEVVSRTALPDAELPRLCFELLRVIGNGERFVEGEGRVQRVGTQSVVRLVVEHPHRGLVEWIVDVDPRFAHKVVRELRGDDVSQSSQAS